MVDHEDSIKKLYLIGLGLGDVNDITIKGLEIVMRVGRVYLENYTSILCCGREELEEFYGRSIEILDREKIESTSGSDEIIESAKTVGAAVLVVGDPLGATTHTDLLLRASNSSVPYQIIHNASIMNAVACCGLQLYSFGETVSIPMWEDTWEPESFYDKILSNRERNLHTLCLLDIKVKEPNLELLKRGITKMEPPRFMSVSQATKQLVAITHKRKLQGNDGDQQDEQSSSKGVLEDSTICIGLARVGGSTQKIIRTTLAEATKIDLGPPLHSLVIPAKILHPLEADMINLFTVTDL